MIKTAIYAAILLNFLGILVNAQVKTKVRPSKPIPFGPATDDIYKLSEGIDQFSMQLLKQILQETGEKNSIVSPFSVWTLLSLLSEGAAGETHSEMITVLRHLDKETTQKSYKTIEEALSAPNKLVQLEMNNDIFMSNSVQLGQDYHNLAKTLYKTNITQVNFSNRSTLTQMNKIIETATRGKITNAFKESDLLDAVVILSNTIYFNGKWTIPFEVSSTKREPFYDHEGSVIGEVNMMRQSGPYSNKYFQDLESEIVEIPYGEPDCYDFYDILPVCTGTGERAKDNKPKYSMYAVIPSNKMSLDELLTKLSKTSIRKLYDVMDANPMKNLDTVDLHVPRFKMTSDLSMKETLKKMGINKAFDTLQANFSLLSPKRDLVLSKVCHKALIEVTEEGTEASAASLGILIDRITPGSINMNRPFVYMIVERLTSTILFVGTYGKPSLY